METEIQTVEQSFVSLQDLVSKVDTRINDHLTYELALDAISQAKEISRKWCALYEDIRAAQNKALDATYAAINKIKVPAKSMVEVLTSKCSDWDRRQKQIARELEMKANEAAMKAAEDAIIKEAEHAAAMGDVNKAKAILDTPIAPVPVVHFTPPAPAFSNLNKKTKWKAQVSDLAALIKAVADKVPGVPNNVLAPDMTVLNKLAATLGEELRIPGVEVIEDFTYARKSR